MATPLLKGTLYTPELTTDLITKVQGKSSLAILSAERPMPFNGSTEFVFTMDSEVDVVAENGKKTHGGISVEPVTIQPIKVEYGARVTDEFMYAAEETQLDILQSFNEGFSRKIARGLDLMAFHGINPRTGTSSAVIGANNFDAKVTQSVTYAEATPDDNVEAAVAMVQGSTYDVSGMAMSPIFAGALAKIKVNGMKQYPELAWGANPGSINGLQVDINSTISDNASKDRAIIGDFANMFRWGFSREIPFEVIKYGDPDNSGKDLKGYNQIYLRTEMFIGWGILEPKAFAIISTTP